MKCNIPYLFTIAIILVYCQACEPENNRDEPHPVVKETLSGAAQKGPFVNGSSISISELTEELNQTGRSYQAEILDNRGRFSLNQVELTTQYADLRVDGFYFNEISNSLSSARLILYTLSDLSDKSELNINLMSHLERGRIKSLVSEGLDFREAKRQAQKEVLRIFSIEKAGIAESELLDISKPEDDHAILLAVSVILQGHRTVAELSELLANINTDFREDGVLDDPLLGSSLVNHAVVLNLPVVREHLEARYRDVGVELELPDFEKYVNMFLEQTEFEVTSFIEYPEFSEYGENILYADKSTVKHEQSYSLAAEIPTGGSLMIRLSGGLWGYRTMPDGPVNWDVSTYDWETESQTFTSIESGTACDLSIIFFSESDSTLSGDGILVEYFENQTDSVTRSKYITVEPAF
jgi:hypothetical protein